MGNAVDPPFGPRALARALDSSSEPRSTPHPLPVWTPVIIPTNSPGKPAGKRRLSITFMPAEVAEWSRRAPMPCRLSLAYLLCFVLPRFSLTTFIRFLISSPHLHLLLASSSGLYTSPTTTGSWNAQPFLTGIAVNYNLPHA